MMTTQSSISPAQASALLAVFAKVDLTQVDKGKVQAYAVRLLGAAQTSTPVEAAARKTILATLADEMACHLNHDEQLALTMVLVGGPVIASVTQGILATMTIDIFNFLAPQILPLIPLPDEATNADGSPKG